MADPEQAAKDTATQQRIINHMNKDHHDSIIRYLEHHHSLSPFTASSSRMTAMDLNGMTFRTSSGKKTYHIPFNPPLESYASARPRVVAMDQESLSALRRSPITISTFPTPSTTHLLALLICTATFLAFSQRWWFAPSGAAASLLGSGFARFAWSIQPKLFWGMVLIHGAELAWFVPCRLRRHSVDVRSGVFWTWCAAEFVAGVFCTGDFDALVERVRREKDGAKH